MKNLKETVKTAAIYAFVSFIHIHFKNNIGKRERVPYLMSDSKLTLGPHDLVRVQLSQQM